MMMEFLKVSHYTTLIVLSLVSIFFLCFFYYLFKLFSFKRDNLERAINSICYEKIDGLILESIDGGEILIDHLLLTAKGLLIVDIKDVEGNVFAGDKLLDWSVITDNRRYTFPNPQPALRDRIIAVQRVVKQVPVFGRVLFLKDSQFKKETPDLVTNLDNLIDDFQEKDKNTTHFKVKAFMPYWDLVIKKAIPNT
ncbi:MAG: hypothetical protein CMQ54_05080 [Gammaproteobacteria bacterium]|nr:hypothetical protein [Gammaproteobacteria bacterium]